MKTIHSNKFYLTAFAALFVLLTASVWPAVHTYADDASSTPPTPPPAPVVTSISPVTGSADGGDSVSISGSGFTGVTGVDFGSTAAASFMFNSDSSITATSPAGDAGAVDITVTTSNGTSATSPADQFTYLSSTSDTSVNTGNADAQGNSDNDVNTNDSSTTPATASSTPDTGNLTVTGDNTASTTDSSSASADTGDNTATTTDGDADINTGNAVASANVLNVINTNIVDSSGLLDFANFFASLGINLDNLDLSYFTNPSAGTDCSFGFCNNGNLTVSTTNTADATNTVSVIANTGSNVASSTDGTVTVTTGNAYASGNAVNVINSNIIQSNYLLVGVNNFGSLNGNLTLPSDSFFDQLLSLGSNLFNMNVTTNNTASVTDSTNASADSGDNAATSTGDDGADIDTGNAISSATTLNQVNTNQVGGTTVYFLFRIWGSFNGSVEGLPPGLTWQQTPDGLVISNSAGGPVDLGQSGGNVNASSTNDASLSNNVNVYALTGDNEASGSGSDISTGNAYASANSVNIVNTNLIGTNWIYAIFNIFGNLNGNIDFGEPNLWLGMSADASTPTAPNTDVPFTFTVTNNGDADATNVILSASFLQDMLDFGTGSSTDSSTTWNLGTIATGQTKQFTYDAETGSVAPGGTVVVPVTATVTSDETDSDPSDNTDSLSLVVSNPDGGGGSTYYSQGGGSSIVTPQLKIIKTADTTATTAPATINYTINMTNNGTPAYDAIATDTLTDPNGNVVSTQSWNLDTINAGDQIKITYSTTFASTSAPGNYTNVVTVDGDMNNPTDPSLSVPFPEASASSTIAILPSAAPQCVPYLTSYLKFGANNDPSQVTKLQTFLKEDAGDTDVAVSGVFDTTTQAAVDRFQAKYASDVLSPWGYNQPTGYVYYTTQMKINNLWCAGQATFPLTQAQMSEISITRALITSFLRQNHNSFSGTTTAPTLPPGVQVGVAPSKHDSTGKSWFSQIIGAPQSLMANVLTSFNSVKNLLSIR